MYSNHLGGSWEEIEITVHLPREDITVATGKVHQLIDALPGEFPENGNKKAKKRRVSDALHRENRGRRKSSPFSKNLRKWS